jgi:hypothetical protein
LYGIIEQEEVGCHCTKRRAQCVTGIRDRERAEKEPEPWKKGETGRRPTARIQRMGAILIAAADATVATSSPSSSCRRYLYMRARCRKK